MNPLQQIGTFGQSVWLDFISRKAIQDGTLQRYIDSGVVGMTSNPAIFEKAMNGSDYDSEISALATTSHSPEQIYQNLAVADVKSAADLLHPTFQRSAHTDGFISLEVSPVLARDTEGTVREAKMYWNWLGKPNVMIKIPATVEGLPAIEASIAAGLSINVTLLFSISRYEAVAEAYIKGLEKLHASGGDVSRVRSVASFFLSRIDSMVDPMLEQIGSDEALALRGKTAIAAARGAYASYERIFNDPRFQTLAAKGAKPQRLLWASTSTKNPKYADTMYVEPLIGPDTVNTMPPDTIAAYLDHGKPADRIRDNAKETQQILADLGRVGINLAKVADDLEAEGLVKFVEPYHKLIALLEQKHAAAVSGAVATS